MDIVGSAVRLDLLGVERFEASSVPTGRGWIKAAHGRMPLPAPATAEILKGVPLTESQVDGELTTPTGAAILTTVADRFGSFPALTIETIGLGTGYQDFRSGQHPPAVCRHHPATRFQRPNLGSGNQSRRPAR